MTYRNTPLPGLPDPDTRPEFYDGVAVKRALAWVIDTVLTFLMSALIVLFTVFIGIFFFGFLMLVTGFLYRWATLAAGSATWGMRMMAIELREADGMRLRGATAFAHTLGYSISVAVFPLQLVSAALMLGTPRGQGLSDMVLGTAALNRPA